MGYFISEKFSKTLIFIGVSLLVIFIIIFSYKAILFNFDVPIKTDVFGQFGDIVGGVIGSLWALAGVILFYAGLNEQRKDIKTNKYALEKQIEALGFQKDEMALQREEFILARQVFIEQKEALREQADNFRVQQFESNLYSLLNIYIGIRNQLINEKKSFIASTIDKLSQVNLSSCNIQDKTVRLNEKYLDLYYDNKEKISHYLKTVYRIYKTIDEQQDLSDEKKYFYSKIVRSQLTEDELVLMYYNAHSIYGQNFRKLILKYNILKHLMLFSKFEFNCFTQKDITIDTKRYLFYSSLDSFLSKNLNKMYDLEETNPEASYAITTDNSTSLIVRMSLDLNNDIEVVFENLLPYIKNNLELNFSDFVSFINHYFYDRMFASKFYEYTDNELNVSFDENESKVKIVVSSLKRFTILEDMF